MIKPLKSSDRIVRPFKTFKKWSFTNIDSSDVILLEQALDETEIDHHMDDLARVPLGWENENGASPEQQDLGNDEIDINVKYGEPASGTFYPKGHRKYDPTKEPVNFDGSYYRVVYNTIKHLFYNEYFVQHYDYNARKKINIKNPLMLFGVESAEYHDPSVVEDIDTGESYTDRRIERRVLGDNVMVLEIPRKQFGEKIRPTSFKILDYSSDFEVIEIVDDGYTNLITGDGIFEDIKRINIETADKILAFKEPNEKFDARDFSFGEQLASSGKYFITGCPMELDELSESQTGTAFLYKHDDDAGSFRLLRAFECPFTQNGLALEQRHDHNNLLLKQLNGILISNDYSLNDNFGSAVELNERYCAMGSSKSHIRGESREESTGHVFVYERNKGGNDHWGLLNIIEGLPGSKFGASISIDGDLMAVGSPGILNGSGVVYIFRREQRVKESSWNRITDVPEGYVWNEDEKRFRGYPQDPELEQINDSTTRWKIKSVIPDGTLLGCFLDIGTFEFESSTFIPGHYKPDTIISGSFESGSCISGSWIPSSCISGSFESGSWISGSFESGSWISGSCISGSFESGSCIPESRIPESRVPGDFIPGHFEENVLVSGSFIPGSFDCPGECGLVTFDGHDILTQGTTRDSEFEFDTGFPPHEYDESPKRSHGDSHWVFDSYVIAEDVRECDKFGEKIKLVGNTLYVSTPSSERQICYVFERGPWSECELWREAYRITREGVHDIINQKYIPTTPPERSATITYPFDYSDPDVHEFGKSIDATDDYLAIGDPLDRKYSTQGSTYEGGAVYIYELSSSTGIKFKHKLYGEFQSEDFFSSRFGNSVSLMENDILIGSHCTDTSNIEITDSGLSVDDYYFGTDNIGQDSYSLNGESINAVEGRAFYYRLTDEPSLLKKIKMNKWKNSVRRQYGYSVSLSPAFIYVGLPVIGQFPFTELITFDESRLSVTRDYKINPHETEAREAMFAYYQFDDLQLQRDDRDFSGQVIAYKTESVRYGNRAQVGNIFYKNGVVVLTELKNHFKTILQGSFSDGYQLEFNGTHTLYETEILCKVEPNEFNVSTNPTALLRDNIIYDINGDGKFDIRDLIYIYKFLMGYKDAKISGETTTSEGEVPGGISVEQDTHWPNSDILLTESEDAILMFLDAAAENMVLSEYERMFPILQQLKSNGELDINDDGHAGSADAQLLVRYFRGMTGAELVEGLLTKGSKRRIPTDILEFLDKRTGKNNGIEIISDFEKFTNLSAIMNDGKNLESLHPYATTIGLYSGLELVAVAKVGKPTKITPSYPINFLIKYDG